MDTQSQDLIERTYALARSRMTMKERRAQLETEQAIINCNISLLRHYTVAVNMPTPDCKRASTSIKNLLGRHHALAEQLRELG